MKPKKNRLKSSAQKQRAPLPPIDLDKIEINEDGYCNKTPRGWIHTNAPKESLDRIGIKCVEVNAGRKNAPRLERAYHPNDKIRVYRREKSGTIIPRIEEVPLNDYGDARDRIPYRWIQTSLTKSQLNKIKVPYLIALKGWTRSRGSMQPIKVKCFHPEHEKAVLEYLPSRRSKTP